MEPRGYPKFLLHSFATDGTQRHDSDKGQDEEADEEDKEWNVGVIGRVLYRNGQQDAKNGGCHEKAWDEKDNRPINTGPLMHSRAVLPEDRH